MPRQIIGRVVLVFAVLLAQQTALAHDFWHAAKAQGLQDQKSPSSKGEKLCDLHDLLGTVLGALSGATFDHGLLSLSDPAFVPHAAKVAEAKHLSPHSRGPPLSS